MKPSSPEQIDSRKVITPAVKRVEIEFRQCLGWQVEVGRTPMKAFPTPQSVRDNARSNRYKRSPSQSRLHPVDLSGGLVMAA